MSEATITYKIALAEYLSGTSDNISLFWKGRVALYALLKSYGIKKDDEIILPAFTCVVVPNAIIYCEAKPVYVDINPQTLNCDPEEIKKKIRALPNSHVLHSVKFTTSSISVGGYITLTYKSNAWRHSNDFTKEVNELMSDLGYNTDILRVGK